MPEVVDPVLEVRIVEGATAITEPSSWAHDWTCGGEVTLSMAKSQGCHILRFPDGRLFVFEREERRVTCPSPFDGSIRHQLLDHVLPRVLDDLGHLMVHGSAVNTPNGPILFIGDSGAGKSTLAASFESVGFELLSDDCARLGTAPDKAITCTPTYRSLRLWPDSANALMPNARSELLSDSQHKRRISLPEPAAEASSTAVAAICVLTAPAPEFRGIQLNELAPSLALSHLLAQCFRLDPTDNEATKRTFERAAVVVDRVPIVELVYDRIYDRLPEVREAVLNLSASVNPASTTPEQRPADRF